MKRLLIIFVLLLLLFPTKVEADVFVSAKSAILVEEDSMRILYSKNIHEKRPIASITKIMTAILAIESNKMNNMVTVGDEIEGIYGSAIYIEKGEVISLKDLVYGLMLQSGNDAALVIAKYVSGSVEDFVTLMNKKAYELGMENTLFQNPHGLDDNGGNISTAYDMALLTSYAMKNKEFREIFKTKKHVVKTERMTYVWYNKNKLLTLYKYTTGGKPGFTDLAYRTLVTTAKKDNLKLICVTLNAPNDWDDHRNLYEYAFETYKSYQILDKNNFKVVDDYFYKDKLYIKNNFYYPLTEREKDDLLIKISLKKIKGYKEGEKVGFLEVFLKNKLLYKEDIYTHIKTPKKSIIRRIIEWLAYGK